MSSTLSRRTLLAGAVAVPLAAASGCGGDNTPHLAPGVESATFLTTFGTQGRDAYCYVADALGFFTEEDLDVTIVPGAGGQNYVDLAAGTAQFAAVDSSGAFIRYAAGADTGFRIISAVHQQPPVSLVAFADTGIRNPGDLEGRTIGLAAESIAELLWPKYAELAGIDATLVETVTTSPQTQVAELVGGVYDAIGLFAFGTPSVEAAGGRDTVVLPWGDFLPELYGAVIVTTPELIETNPELVSRFNRAILRGLEHSVAHPSEAVEILATAAAEQQDNTAANVRELTLMAPYVNPSPGIPIGGMERERVTRSLGVLQSTGVIPAESRLTVEQEVMAWELIPAGD